MVNQGAGEAATPTEKPSAVGWEKDIQGKLGARVADLAPLMDPTWCHLGFLSLGIQQDSY